MFYWKAFVEYEGTVFSGWQKQHGVITVQEVIETALFEIAGKPVVVSAAGRTDAGVHAFMQVIHFVFEKDFDSMTFKRALNAKMKNWPVCVWYMERVNHDFHARFSACKRSYFYRLCTSRFKPAFGDGYMWSVRRSLDVDAMREAALHWIGYHDFTSFRAKACQALSPEKTVDKILIKQQDDYIGIYIEARSFLYHQVRNFVGTLKKIGQGSWAPEKALEVLLAKDRCAAAETAPARGLFLYAVWYGEETYTNPLDTIAENKRPERIL